MNDLPRRGTAVFRTLIRTRPADVALVVLFVTLVIVGVVLLATDARVEEYHHAVVRQCTATQDGWLVVVEGEVGAFWSFATREYREPGSSLYVGLSRRGWRITAHPR